ncbi:MULTISPECIES: carotenoid oxygenase family protein [Streptomycetaceae]|uniref:Dioxygenase n=1 Tax=Streptantibioticus cattleyicolor (strain ATCC 35852 / DSM 46488 / JCM 4925 / NBRC 14057 / NRRL 8057) TaxID=1003195 RepID=F8JXK4_STREN|nr:MULTISPECIES: carotenoid oxygenase family protein [Streptomycetaceae]AEW97107.1 dioxygenase [Streptantibioticus cattleyicolor NRRL 8057 = DSM 46488]MYS61566.1 dioxygenase [Streptomyces sp. SID5468]CCB77430.1 Dioxygenase [Streptantibioticus cattleyicolor NRRL 8057 = DSM 46488]
MTADTPAYLSGHLAPVPDETEAHDLPVTGTLPPELTGRYFRNGPNPLPGQDPGHWFAGQGMLHGIRLRDGRAEWYRNRWVRTRAMDGVPLVDENGTVDRTAVTANTHVIPHADKIYALVESGLPYEVTPELETVGPCDFGGRLTTAMTAHPKADPRTGELLFFGYGFAPPYLTYHRLSASGELVESREIAVPGPTMTHDFAITANHVVWLDLPVVFDLSLTGRGMPYRWDDDYGARIGVMPRTPGAPVRWFDVDPAYVFHVGNAYEDEQGRVVLDAVRYSPRSFQETWGRMGGGSAARRQVPVLHRWLLDPATGQVRETPLDDRMVEFPTIDEERTGLANRHVYAVGQGELIKYDTRTGATRTFTTGEDTRPGEAVFVPAADATAEDDGWLLSLLSTPGSAELLVLDAHDLSRVATIHLPRRVPAGFHGHWIPDA